MRAARFILPSLFIAGVAGAVEPSVEAGRALFIGTRALSRRAAPPAARATRWVVRGSPSPLRSARSSPRASPPWTRTRSRDFSKHSPSRPWRPSTTVAPSPRPSGRTSSPSSSRPRSRDRRTRPGTSRRRGASSPSCSSLPWRSTPAAGSPAHAHAYRPRLPLATRRLPMSWIKDIFDPDERRWEEIYRNRWPDRQGRPQHPRRELHRRVLLEHPREERGRRLETQAIDYPRISTRPSRPTSPAAASAASPPPGTSTARCG